MRAYERLLRYVKFDTASDASSQSCPSTKKQLALAKALAEELLGLGLDDAHVDKDGYVYLDHNHELAGEDLYFEIELLDAS